MLVAGGAGGAADERLLLSFENYFYPAVSLFHHLLPQFLSDIKQPPLRPRGLKAEGSNGECVCVCQMYVNQQQ